MTEHIDDKILEKLFICPGELSYQEKDDIALHLESCSLCKEHAAKLKLFYEDLQTNLDTLPTERDEAFAEKLLTRQRLALPEKKLALQERVDNALSTFVEIIEPYRRPLAYRFVRYIKLHPVRFAGATSLAGFALVAAFLLVKPAFKDKNPAFAEIINYVLTVYNKDAKVLWTKSVFGITFRSSTYDVIRNGDPRFLRMGDLDGDGINEILISGTNRSGSFTVDSLYCYEYDGSLRWAINSGKIISFGDTTIQQHSVAAIMDILIMKNTTTSHPKLFIVANELNFSPSKLAELDPKTGRELQAYYNRGGAGLLLSADIDRDGRNELLLFGINDAFNRTFLSVLDPSDINGYAPVTAQYLLHNVSSAREKYYMLFPRTFLAKEYSQVPYNVPSKMWTDKGKVYLQIEDMLGKFSIKDLIAQVIFTFDSTMHVESVAPGNGLIKAQEYLLQNSMLKKPLIPDYLKAVKDSVLYWNGEKFQNKPTRNKLYSSKNLP